MIKYDERKLIPNTGKEEEEKCRYQVRDNNKRGTA